MASMDNVPFAPSMIPSALAEVLVLLAAALAVVVAFQRLRLPSSLGYLLVGALVGPHSEEEGESLCDAVP